MNWLLIIGFLILGMLMANMLVNVCGCKNVVEGGNGQVSPPTPTSTPGSAGGAVAPGSAGINGQIPVLEHDPNVPVPNTSFNLLDKCSIKAVGYTRTVPNNGKMFYTNEDDSICIDWGYPPGAPICKMLKDMSISGSLTISNVLGSDIPIPITEFCSIKSIFLDMDPIINWNNNHENLVLDTLHNYNYVSTHPQDTGGEVSEALWDYWVEQTPRKISDPQQGQFYYGRMRDVCAKTCFENSGT